MANPEHRAKLEEGVESWNLWRKQNSGVEPDLSGANLRRSFLRGVNLRGADLSKADLHGADLRGAILRGADVHGAILSCANLGGADLREADLRQADLSQAGLRRARLYLADLGGANLHGAGLGGANLHASDLRYADFSQADLRRAYLSEVDLRAADLSEADLREADLRHSTLVETKLEGTNLTACYVYGISAWNVRTEAAIQANLVITSPHESPIEVDNLEVAQFIYLLLNNEKIRDVIDTITSKVVLILGRFTPERKAVLDAIREELRRRNYLPVLFDFKKPDSRNFTETISTLAHMARFVIADLTDPRSIPQELAKIIPALPSVPVQPLLLKSENEYGMFQDFRDYPWVLEPFRYTDQGTLLAELAEKVIAPAEKKAKGRNK